MKCLQQSGPFTGLIVSPDSKIPPNEVQKFFDGLSQKNNLCVLTGDKTAMGSVEKAARQHFGAPSHSMAISEIPTPPPGPVARHE